MKRELLMPGVALTQLPADAFKRCTVSLNFILKGDRSTATAYALLPLVMERGYSACPDMTVLSRRLAQLYGAGLSVSGGTLGPNRVITVGLSGIRNEYAVGGEDLLNDYLELVFGMAFSPDVKNGAFAEDAVEIEKDKLRELQLSEINDKRLYCLRQARRKFYGDNVAGLEKYGYAEELAGLTPQRLYQAWQAMVCSAQLEVLVLGTQAEPVKLRLQQALAALPRRPETLNPALPMPVQPTQQYTEPVEAVQGKLCMVFTLQSPLAQQDLSKMRMAVAMLGGTPTSRLFMNVREKQSLCYYCAAGYSQLGGTLSIDSGVEPQNAERTKQAVLKEIDSLIHGEISEKEMEDTRRYLLCALDGVEDSLSGLENWTMGEISRDTLYTPAQVMQQIREVTVEDVRTMLQKFSLSVVYVLNQGGETNE